MLGAGDRARRLIDGLRLHPEFGLEVAGWSGENPDMDSRDRYAEEMLRATEQRQIRRVIVAISDRHTVIGTSVARHDLSGLDAPLRSHGGISEQ